MSDNRMAPEIAFGKPIEGFSLAVASEVTEKLHERWAEYTEHKAAADECPNLLDFFAWLFFTEGWRARGQFEDLDQFAADHQKQDI